MSRRPGYTGKDSNQDAIVAALEEQGFAVKVCSTIPKGPLDLLVKKGDWKCFVEIKNLEGHRLRFTESEKDWLEWLDDWAIVAVSVDDVLKAYEDRV